MWRPYYFVRTKLLKWLLTQQTAPRHFFYSCAGVTPCIIPVLFKGTAAERHSIRPDILPSAHSVLLPQFIITRSMPTLVTVHLQPPHKHTYIQREGRKGGAGGQWGERVPKPPHKAKIGNSKDSKCSRLTWEEARMRDGEGGKAPAVKNSWGRPLWCAIYRTQLKQNLLQSHRDFINKG